MPNSSSTTSVPRVRLSSSDSSDVQPSKCAFLHHLLIHCLREQKLRDCSLLTDSCFFAEYFRTLRLTSCPSTACKSDLRASLSDPCWKLGLIRTHVHQTSRPRFMMTNSPLDCLSLVVLIGIFPLGLTRVVTNFSHHLLPVRSIAPHLNCCLNSGSSFILKFLLEFAHLSTAHRLLSDRLLPVRSLSPQRKCGVSTPVVSSSLSEFLDLLRLFAVIYGATRKNVPLHTNSSPQTLLPHSALPAGTHLCLFNSFYCFYLFLPRFGLLTVVLPASFMRVQCILALVLLILKIVVMCCFVSSRFSDLHFQCSEASTTLSLQFCIRLSRISSALHLSSMQRSPASCSCKSTEPPRFLALQSTRLIVAPLLLGLTEPHLLNDTPSVAPRLLCGCFFSLALSSPSLFLPSRLFSLIFKPCIIL